ncbi:flavohemoprotein [Minicystis rosea]|nr:flavohemoprotein [Minicystis rosea]
MGLNVALLRRSFELIAERAPDLTHRFYEILFARHPEVRLLFGRNNTRLVQEEMLSRALGAVMDHLDDAPWLAETLGSLGDKHVAYGVTNEMYSWVGDALVAALAEVAGEEWTPEVERAWIEAYGAIAGLMMAGSGAPVSIPKRISVAAPA